MYPFDLPLHFCAVCVRPVMVYFALNLYVRATLFWLSFLCDIAATGGCGTGYDKAGAVVGRQ